MVNDKRTAPGDRSVGGRKPYERPEIKVFTDEEILEIIGPAQGYSGDPIGTSGGSSF